MKPADRAAALLALATGGTAGVLLWRLLFQAQAHTFDTLIYARSLWGMAHGDGFNPVLGQPVLAIHAHLLSAVLAPLARFLPSALVLILAQSAALAVTVYLVASALGRAAGGSTWVALWGGTIAVIATPLVLNPFLFDARPDLLGVPLLTAGLLRGVRRGGLDRRAIALIAAAALAREELALAAACGIALAPDGAGAVPRRTRWLLAAAIGSYFLLYYFGLRVWLGGSNASSLAHLSGAGPGSAPPDWPQLAGRKLETLLVLAASGGSLVCWGYRWLGAALPGLGMLLLSRWMVDHLLSSHYCLFAAPGVLAAIVAGYRRLHTAGAGPAALRMAAVSVVAAASYRFAAAAPGGARFAAARYDLVAADGSLELRWARRPELVLIHQRLAELDPDAGIAVPWPFAAPLADRPFIWTDLQISQAVAGDEPLPPELRDVALGQSDLARIGRTLVEKHGFALAGFAGRPLEVLTRDPAERHIPWPAIARLDGAARCPTPLQRWPAAGLNLCRMGGGQGNPVEAEIARTGPGPGEPVRLLVMSSDGAVAWLDLLPLGGLVNLADLPLSASIVVRSDAPLAGAPGRVVLLGSAGPTGRHP